MNTLEKQRLLEIRISLSSSQHGRRLPPALLYLVIACVLLAPLVTTTETAFAVVDATKAVKWQTWAKGGIAGMNGAYTLTAKAKASGKHNIQPYTVKVASGAWPLGVGTGGLIINDLNPETNGHADAWSLTDIIAPAAIVVGSATQNPQRIEVEPVIGVFGDKRVDSPHDGHVTARHNGKGVYAIRGAKAQDFDLRASINNLRIRARGKGRPMVAINEQGQSLHDPVTITLIETATGIEHTEQLFSLDIASQNEEGTAVSWDYDWVTGVSISMQRDPSGIIAGSVSIGGSANSAWLVDPIGDFGVSLSNGVFMPTGAWASLPWALTFDGGDVVAATLAPENLL